MTAAHFDTYEDYPPGMAEEARKLCLHVAAILGDFRDELVLVGGLVPYLLVDQEANDVRTHVGTRDLDIGLSIAVLDSERYRSISEGLRNAGFKPAEKNDGTIRRQMWRSPISSITIDFLIAPTDTGPGGGKLQNLESDFAAIVTPALPLAFLDCIDVLLEGELPNGARIQRSVRVCGPAAFVILKAHAMMGRLKRKDAYDLVYMLQYYGQGTSDIAKRFDLIAGSTNATKALDILRNEFAAIDYRGPQDVAEFQTGRVDPIIQADAWGTVQEFLDLVHQTDTE